MKIKFSLCIFFILVFMQSCSTITSGDPLSHEQWYIRELSQKNNTDDEYVNIGIKKMWQLSDPDINKNTVVAVLDTGINQEHEDLANAMWINDDEIMGDNIDNDKNNFVDDYYGYNFIDNIGITKDNLDITREDNHGTAISGIIGAIHDNGFGIKGIVNNSGLKIMQLKTIDMEPTSQNNNLDNIIKSIKYAEDNGAKICNMSFTFDYFDKKLLDTINSSSMLFIIASGNSLTRGISVDNRMQKISQLENVVIVTSIDSNGKIDTKANYGRETVHIAAPGCDIFTTCVDGDYKSVTGTSFSNAIVTGIATLIYQNSHSSNPYEVKKIICKTATKTDELENKVISGGYINGYEALLETKD